MKTEAYLVRVWRAWRAQRRMIAVSKTKMVVRMVDPANACL